MGTRAHRWSCALLALAATACAEVGPAWERLPTEGLAPRWGQVALIDPARDRMLILGGENERGALAEVLALDLGTLTWSEVATENTPLARTDFAAVLDAPRDRVIVIGGRQAFAGSVGETWALDLASGRWSPLPAGPSARHDISAASDGERVWVFGGAGAFLQSLEDFWELDLRTDTWRELPSDVHPSARTSYATAYFDGSVWLHGGHDAITAFHDSWRFDVAEGRWEPLSVTGGSAAAAHFAHTVDPTCGALLMTGGDNLDNFDVAFTDALVFGEAPRFARVPASELPPPRDHASLALDPLRRRLILFGGGAAGDGLGTLSDAWIRPLEGCP